MNREREREREKERERENFFLLEKFVQMLERRVCELKVHHTSIKFLRIVFWRELFVGTKEEMIFIIWTAK